MSSLRQKFTSFMMLFVSLAFLSAAGAGWYFLEYQKRLDYFEQLRFRQLAESARSLDTNLASFNALSRELDELARSDLSVIFPIYKKIKKSTSDVAYENDVSPQSGLLLFTDDGCNQKDKEWGLSLADRFSRRNPEWKKAVNFDLGDGKTILSTKEILSRLEMGMCLAGQLAGSPYPKSIRKEDIVKRLDDLVDLKASIDKAVVGVGGSVSEGYVVERLKLLELPSTILTNLIDSLTWFRFYTSDFSDLPEYDGYEHLTASVQSLISDFWKRNLGSENVNRKHIQKIDLALKKAGVHEKVKSRRALEKIIDIVSSRYQEDGSAWSSVVKSHRLEVSAAPGGGISKCSGDSEPGLLYFDMFGSKNNKSPYPDRGVDVVGCASIVDFVYRIPFSQLISFSGYSFPILLVVDRNGSVLFAGGSGSESLYQGKFEEIFKIRSGSNSVRGSGNEFVSDSGNGWKNSSALKVDFAGRGHDAYVLPHRVGSSIVSQEEGESGRGLGTLYFVGLVPSEVVSKEALRLSPSVFLILSVIGVSILLSFLFLKIRWSHISSAFTRSDRYVVSSAVVIMAIIVSVSWVSYLVSDRIESDFKGEAKSALMDMKASFREELLGAFNTVDMALHDLGVRESLQRGVNESLSPGERKKVMGYEEYKSPSDCVDIVPGVKSYVTKYSIGVHGKYSGSRFSSSGREPFLCGLEAGGGYPAGSNHPIENLFIIKKDGGIAGNIIQGSKWLFQSSRPNLSHRKYFKNAQKGDLVEWNNDGEKLSFSVERIFNISDGARSTQIAIPLESECKKSEGWRGLSVLCDQIGGVFGPGMSAGKGVVSDKNGSTGWRAKADFSGSVLSFGLSFVSLISPVLPNNLNYIVFDNRDGQVLYHSQKSRVLVENFFDESEHNKKIRAYLDVVDYGAGNADRVLESVDGIYRGKRTRFYLTQLDKALPWTILVYHDLEYVQSFTALHFLISGLFCVFLVAIVCFILVLIRPLLPEDLFIWLWPRADAVSTYRNLSWCLLLAILVVGMFLGILVGLANSSGLRLVILSGVGVLGGIFILSQANRVYAVLSGRKQSAEGCMLAGRASGFLSPATGGAGRVGCGCLEPLSLSRKMDTTRRISFWYSMFVTLLIFLLVLIPSTLVAYVAGDALIRSMGDYDRMVMNVDSQIQLRDRREYFSRVYGYGKGTDFENRRTEEKLENLIYRVGCEAGATSNNQLERLKGASCPVDHDFSDSPSMAGRDFVVNGLLNYIAVGWSRAEVLSSLVMDLQSNLEGESKVIKNSSDHVPNYSYSYPSLFGLVFSSWNSAFATLVFMFLLILVFLAVRFLALYLVGAMVPFSYLAGAYIKRQCPVSWLSECSANAGTVNGAAVGVAAEDSESIVSGSKNLVGTLQKVTPSTGPHHALLIRPRIRALEFSSDFPVSLNSEYERDSASGRRCTPVDVWSITTDKGLRESLLDGATREDSDDSRLLLIDNIESVAFTRKNRLALLDILERIVHSGACVSVVVLCDVSPLYMLTNQAEYLDKDQLDEVADAQEVVRWSRLLCCFRKYYDWYPEVLHLIGEKNSAYYLVREISIWPDLHPLQEVISAQLGDESWRLLSEEQIVQFVGSHAASEYRRRWALCTRQERLLLFQLASGLMINPRNIGPLEHLMRRGYIVRNPRWSIANKSFARFILSAEDETVFAAWMEESNRGFWQYLKVPLLLVALTLLGVVIYSTQTRLEGFLALFTGVLTLIPLLMRNISLVKGPGETIPDN